MSSSSKLSRTISDIEKGIKTISNEMPSIYNNGRSYTVKRRGVKTASARIRHTAHNSAALERTEEIKLELAINRLKEILAANKIVKALKKNTQKRKSPSHKETMFTSTRRTLGNFRRSLFSVLQKGGKRTRKQR